MNFEIKNIIAVYIFIDVNDSLVTFIVTFIILYKWLYVRIDSVF